MNLRVLPIVLIAGLLLTGTAFAADQAVKRGGLLYDKWFAGREKPRTNHPLYPATGKKKGAATWRCKECHGWDYIGSRGRYAKGSHFTGIKGTYQVAGKPVSEIESMLKNGKHDFSRVLSNDDIRALATFLSEGQIDIVKFVGSDNRALGEADGGKPLYEENCASCHGTDGGQLDFKAKKDGVQGVGWLARVVSRQVV
ncbi:MAG: hypothetical protein Tsb0017_16070 [Geothermobacteraceae bacterium]